MEQKQKEIVQALLIADNFNENFMPITNKTNVVSNPKKKKKCVSHLPNSRD